MSIQSQEPGIFYSYSNFDNLGVKYGGGVGINLWGWLGIDFSYDNDFNLSFASNITPWYHQSVSLGANGITFTFGITIGNTSHDITFGIGLAPVVIVAGVIAVFTSCGSLIDVVLNWFSKIFA